MATRAGRTKANSVESAGLATPACCRYDQPGFIALPGCATTLDLSGTLPICLKNRLDKLFSGQPKVFQHVLRLARLTKSIFYPEP